MAMRGKKPLILLLFLILVGAALDSIPNLGIVDVSATPLSPYIMIIPEQTVNDTITPGMNYTIAIYTDYNGSDIWQWQFELTFDPAILEGLEVRNGDLITKDKDSSARFIAGDFDNNLGKLGVTVGFFFFMSPPPATTTGPGVCAYVTFRVVGTGISDITLGGVTWLIVYEDPDLFPKLIRASEPPGKTEPPYGSDHIGHGFFDNIPPVHDVAVTKMVAPATALVGENVTIDVTVANEGNYTETFDVTVTANTTQIGTQTVTNLTRGSRIIRTFTWNTTGITAGNYTLNATALLTDSDMSDNNRTATIEIKVAHDVAIIDLKIPSHATLGEHVTINVTVANRGNYEENANLTVYYEPIIPGSVPYVINTTSFMIDKTPTSETISMNWNTTGLVNGYFKIQATVTIDQDEDLSDNTWTEYCELQLAHDVAITSVSPTPHAVFVGELVEIRVNLYNAGANNETFEVKVTYDTSDIDTKLVESMLPGNSTSLMFTWNTTGVDPASYEITAEAMLAADLDPLNNKKTASAYVNPPLGNIEGIVKDANTDSPIAGVTVTAGTYTNTTNADGYYEISDVPAGTYTVTASKDGFQTASKTGIGVVAGQATNLNFTLTPLPTNGNIAGIVSDASTGNPIEGANITTNGYFDITDANGHYNISSIPAGTYTVTASKDGYESSSSTNIVVAAGQTTTVDFQLTPKESNILPYVIIAVVAIIAIAGIAFFLRNRMGKTK
jgi:hypothetical protein